MCTRSTRTRAGRTNGSARRGASPSNRFQIAYYQTVDLNVVEAVLPVRTSPIGAKQVVPLDKWSVTDSTHVAIDGGFRAFHWYELVYRSAQAPVVGAGLLAVRDFV